MSIFDGAPGRFQARADRWRARFGNSFVLLSNNETYQATERLLTDSDNPELVSDGINGANTQNALVLDCLPVDFPGVVEDRIIYPADSTDRLARKMITRVQSVRMGGVVTHTYIVVVDSPKG